MQFDKYVLSAYYGLSFTMHLKLSSVQSDCNKNF